MENLRFELTELIGTIVAILFAGISILVGIISAIRAWRREGPALSVILYWTGVLFTLVQAWCDSAIAFQLFIHGMPVLTLILLHSFIHGTKQNHH